MFRRFCEACVKEHGDLYICPSYPERLKNTIMEDRLLLELRCSSEREFGITPQELQMEIEKLKMQIVDLKNRLVIAEK